MPTTAAQIQIAKAHGLINVEPLAAACDKLGLPFHYGCTILEKEGHGGNVFGHDHGGAMYGAGEVTEAKYRQFLALIGSGHTSNGVGPMQLTYRGYHIGPLSLTARGLKAWVPADNILYGVEILARSLKANLAKGQSADQAWWNTAKAYNGGSAYADDAAKKAKTWLGWLTPSAPSYTVFGFNAQFPGFASTHALPWSTRCPALAKVALGTGAGIITTQEMGKDEAASFAYQLGSNWHYQCAQGVNGNGLNCVFWDTNQWGYSKQYDWPLQSFGQWTRTLLVVKLINNDNSYVWAGSTHLAAAASDLSPADAITARKAQATQIGGLLSGFRQLILDGDWNSPYPASVKDSVRQILTARGFTFPPPLKDAKHGGIDGFGTKSRVRLLSETVVPLGTASDHDGRLARFEVIT